MNSKMLHAGKISDYLLQKKTGNFKEAWNSHWESGDMLVCVALVE